ncbi:MAG: carbohydrate kinase family protein [bacterium]
MIKPNKIIISGSIAHDRIMSFPGYFRDHILPDKIHMLNVSFMLNSYKESFGGTAGNIAYNLQMLGFIPVVVGAVGNDFDKYQKHLKKKKIDLSSLKYINSEPTALGSIFTDRADNQITGFYAGAMLHASGFKKIPAQSKMAIVSPGNLYDMKKLPKLFRSKKVPFIYDPGQQIVSLSGGSLIQGMKESVALVGNDYEISLILSKARIKKHNLFKYTSVVITTLGAKGSVINLPDEQIKIPPVKVKKVVDPTGAGDAYRAGLIAGLVSNMPLRKAGRLASMVASYAVEYQGTQVHKFTNKDITKRYKANFKENL